MLSTCNERARDLFEKTDRKSEEADALIGLGYQLLELDKIEKAISLFQRALDQHSEAGNPRGMILGLTNLGIAYAELGRDDEAEQALERAERIADEEDNRVRTMFHLNAVHALALFESRIALERLRDAWSLILEHTDPLERMTAHVLRARLQLEVEDDAGGAAEDARKALDFYRERDVDSRWSREAEEILEKARAHDTS